MRATLLQTRWLIWVLLALVRPATAQLGPQPGEVYREYKRTMRGPSDWRVTDPATREIRAHKFLPNPVLPIVIDDLQYAVRAEILVDRWGGHPGTTVKRLRFNENRWLFLPELETTPPGLPPERFQYQDNPILTVPLANLKQGENLLEGAAGAQIGTTLDWGQWGWSGVVVRIYYDPAKKLHVRGRIVQPSTGQTLGEDPLIRIAPEQPEQVGRVDVLAFYQGYDLDGDGVYADWHRYYHHDRKGPDKRDDPSISGHPGSAFGPPFEVRWDTRYVPDQLAPTVQLAARIQSTNGLWYVTEPVAGLRLERPAETVKLYKPYAVPEKYCSRADLWTMSKFAIPAGDLVSLDPAEAVLHLRTWNGHEKDLWINAWKTPVNGGNHVFAYTRHPFPVELLRKGENRVEFHSETLEHCIEVLWPGPGVTVRYSKPASPGAAP
jgi:hypothetical protein